MRDKNLSFFQFRISVYDYFQKKVKPDAQILRNPVPDSPILLSDSCSLLLPNLKLQTLQGLAILSYCTFDFSLGWKIRMFLWNYCERLDWNDKLRLSVLLKTPDLAFMYFYLEHEYSLHEFFGNVLEAGGKAYKVMRLRVRKKGKVKKTGRRGGYRDHGSLRSGSEWLPSFDWSLTEIQNEKERKEDIYNQLLIDLENDLERKFSLLMKETERLE